MKFDYKNPRFVLFIIFLVTLYALLIDLPKYNLKFSYDFSHFRSIPQIGQWFNDKNLNIDEQIGGYSIDLFNGAFTRDLEIKKGLDIEGGASIILDADLSTIPENDRRDALNSLTNIIERRVNLLGISEASVQSAKQGDKYRVIVELAGIQDPQDAINAIGQTAKLEFRELKGESLPAEITTEQEFNEAFQATDLSGADLKRSNVVFNSSSGIQSGAPQIELIFSTEGARKFRDITQRNLNKPVAIYLDNQLLMYPPTVQSVITSGQAVITGDFTVEQAKTISAQLNAGALPVPVKVVEQRTLGPSLGQESVNKSVIAGLIGLSLVIFFMIGYYGRLGIMASIALIIYGIITLAIYKLVPIVLTLPGLTGFILSIGMAVDANILIFERIKEEIRAGKPRFIALENGFGRSWDSIRDANTATLMTAFILFNPFNWSFLPTSGMVRGFALTLSLGIFISLFTGIFVTRNLVRVFYNPKKND